MSWDTVIGQQRVKELLQRAITGRKVAHAYLFYGAEGVGKDAMAMEFARVLNCEKKQSTACGECRSCRKATQLQHPNIRLIVSLPVGKSEKSGDDPIRVLSEDQVASVQEQLRLKAQDSYYRVAIPKANFIKVNSVRFVRREAAMSSFEGGTNVFIISEAEAMNVEASNSLLKTLEEPSSDSVFILTTSRRQQLLPTILSRCQLVQFDPLSEEEIRGALVSRRQVESEQAALVARLANGSYTAAVEMLSADMVGEREGVVLFLRLVVGGQRVALAKEIERIGSAGDRSVVVRWLKMLQAWLRDALLLRDLGEEGMVAADPTAELNSFVSKFPHADLPEALECVERSIALIDKNVYLPLVLTGLSIDLHRSLVPHR